MNPKAVTRHSIARGFQDVRGRHAKWREQNNKPSSCAHYILPKGTNCGFLLLENHRNRTARSAKRAKKSLKLRALGVTSTGSVQGFAVRKKSAESDRVRYSSALSASTEWVSALPFETSYLPMALACDCLWNPAFVCPTLFWRLVSWQCGHLFMSIFLPSLFATPETADRYYFGW